MRVELRDAAAEQRAAHAHREVVRERDRSCGPRRECLVEHDVARDALVLPMRHHLLDPAKGGSPRQLSIPGEGTCAHAQDCTGAQGADQYGARVQLKAEYKGSR